MDCLLKTLFYLYSKIWSGMYNRSKDSRESADAKSSELPLAIQQARLELKKQKKMCRGCLFFQYLQKITFGFRQPQILCLQRQRKLFDIDLGYVFFPLVYGRNLYNLVLELVKTNVCPGLRFGQNIVKILQLPLIYLMGKVQTGKVESQRPL